MSSIKKQRFMILVVAIAIAFATPTLAFARQQTLTLTLTSDSGTADVASNIQGDFILQATGPSDLVTVKFYMDENIMRIDEQAPFSIEFNTDNYPPTVYVISALGVLANGDQLASNQIAVRFITDAGANGYSPQFFVSLIVIVGIVVLLGSVGLFVLRDVLGQQRERPRRIGEYGKDGGAVCGHCTLPFSRPALSPTLLVVKLSRCPHCDRWSLARRADKAALAVAEERWREARAALKN